MFNIFTLVSPEYSDCVCYLIIIIIIIIRLLVYSCQPQFSITNYTFCLACQSLDWHTKSCNTYRKVLSLEEQTLPEWEEAGGTWPDLKSGWESFTRQGRDHLKKLQHRGQQSVQEQTGGPTEEKTKSNNNQKTSMCTTPRHCTDVFHIKYCGRSFSFAYSDHLWHREERIRSSLHALCSFHAPTPACAALGVSSQQHDFLCSEMGLWIFFLVLDISLLHEVLQDRRLPLSHKIGAIHY